MKATKATSSSSSNKKSKSSKQPQTLISSRYAPMYLPNTSWDFFDAFNRSLPSQMAFTDNVISTEGRNLDKYLRLHCKHLHEDELHTISITNSCRLSLPSYLVKLLSYQDQSGLFKHLSQVLHVLDLSTVTLAWHTIRQYEKYEEWQLATALAMVAMRQHGEYFDLLSEAYQKAKELLGSNNEELPHEIRLLLEDVFAKKEDVPLSSTLEQRLEFNSQVNQTMIISRGSGRGSGQPVVGSGSGNGNGSGSGQPQLGMATQQQLSLLPSVNIDNKKKDADNTANNNNNDDVDQLIAQYLNTSNEEVDNNNKKKNRKKKKKKKSANQDNEEEDDDNDNNDNDNDLLLDEDEDVIAKKVEKLVLMGEENSRNLDDEYLDLELKRMEEQQQADAVLHALQQIDQDSQHDGINKNDEDDDDDDDDDEMVFDFSHLQETLNRLNVSINQEKVNQLEKQINQTGIELVTYALEIEELTKKILYCLQESVREYNESELLVIRYRVFDKLTAMLGDGFTGTAAYDDWRKEGVPGIRPKMIAFYSCLYDLAMLRLSLLEEYMPIGMGKMKEFTEDMKHSRWILRFQGQDLALRVLHSLDFLRKCRELSDWFGQTFYFTANPFMLPFPPKHAYEALKLDDKVQDLYHSTPHHRLGIAQEMNEENNNQWQLLHYLEDFRRQFNLLCTNRVFNWPTVPDIVDNTRNMEFFHAMVTVFICCKDSIDRSYSWETKFQGKISTIRGQDENLIGQNNQRIDKELKIPTLESRKPRYSIIKKIQANKQYTTLMKNNKVVMKGDDRKESIFSVIRADEFQSQQQQQQQSLSSSLTQSKKSMEDVNNTNSNNNNNNIRSMLNGPMTRQGVKVQPTNTNTNTSSSGNGGRTMDGIIEEGDEQQEEEEEEDNDNDGLVNNIKIMQLLQDDDDDDEDGTNTNTNTNTNSNSNTDTNNDNTNHDSSMMEMPSQSSVLTSSITNTNTTNHIIPNTMMRMMKGRRDKQSQQQLSSLIHRRRNQHPSMTTTTTNTNTNTNSTTMRSSSPSSPNSLLLLHPHRLRSPSSSSSSSPIRRSSPSLLKKRKKTKKTMRMLSSSLLSSSSIIHESTISENSELSEQEDDNHNEKGQTKDKMTMMTMTMKGNDDRRIDESQSLQEGSQSLAEGDSQSHVTLSTTQSPFSSSSSQQQQQSSSSNNNNNNNNNNSSSSHMKKKIEKLMKSNADHKMLLLSSKKKNNNNKRRDENGLLTAASTSSSSILSSSNLNENSNSHLLIGSGSRSSSNNNNNNNNESQTNDRNGMTPQRQPNNKQTLYEKKSLYHPSQRISFTGMQQLIRRETDLNNMKHSPEQLSRLQSLRQSYANKKQNTTMIKPSSTPNLIDNVGFSYQPSPKKLLHSRHDLSVLNSDDENKDDENEQKTGNSNSNNNNIVKTRRKANIIKVPDYHHHHHHRKGSSSVLSDNNNKSISAQQSKLSLDVITEEHEMKENHHNDDEGIVKSTSRKSIRSSIRSPGKLSPKKDHDSPPTSNLLTKGKSSSSRRSIYKPSQIQANDSLVSTDSDVADESIDEGHLVAKHRPSVVRQRLKAAIDLSASATGDGGDGNGSGGVVHGRGRVARIALPVLKESVNGSSRVIQGIRPGSEGMHRLTKRGSTVTLSTTTTR